MVVMAAGPRGLPNAEVVLFSPKLSEVSTLLPFFTRAGQGSVMLAPASWREQAHPLLAFDLTRPESATALGISVTDSLSRSTRGPVEVACHSLSDVKVFEAAARSRLERLGAVFRTELKGVITLGARDGLNRVQAAALIKGRDSCSVSATGQSVEKLLPEVTTVLTGKPLAGPVVKAIGQLPAPQYVMQPGSVDGFSVLALSTKGDTLSLDATAKGLPLSALQGPGPSPFAALTVPGAVLTLRMRLAKEQLPRLIEQLAPTIPGGKALLPAALALAPTLTGNVAVVLHRVKVTSGLRTAPARFFAVRAVLLAETSDPGQAKAAADAIDPQRLAVREGRLEVGVQGAVAVLSTDGDARKDTLAALATASGTQPHGASFDVDPARLAQALAAVPLLEVVQTPELAPLLIVSTELGPLLSLTERVRGWVDSAGPGLHRAQLTWSLARAQPGDAGVPP